MSNKKYSPIQVAVAAAGAYCSSTSGDDDEYVINKSSRFVKRCISQEMNYDGWIHRDSIDLVSFAALDKDCEKVLFTYLELTEKDNIEELPIYSRYVVPQLSKGEYS